MGQGAAGVVQVPPPGDLHGRVPPGAVGQGAQARAGRAAPVGRVAVRGPGAPVALVLLAGGLLLGCGAKDDAAAPEPCPPTCPGTPEPRAAPPGEAPPEGSAAYDAVVVEPQPGELARGGNDEDATLTERTFSVVVPAGSRLRTRTVCLGRTEVLLTTAPASAAESALTCGQDEPREIVVEDPAAAPAPTAVTVTVRAAAPARWYAVVSAVPPS